MTEDAPRSNARAWLARLFAVVLVAVWIYVRFVPEDAKAAGFTIPEEYEAVEGDVVTLRTNGDGGERLARDAREAWRAAAAWLEATPDARGLVFVASDLDAYNRLGLEWRGGHQSSNCYAFSTPWRDAGDVDSAGVALGHDDPVRARIHVWHATAEQFLDRLRGPAREPLPPWLKNGLAAYLSRFTTPDLTEWSLDRLRGSAPFDAARFLREYAPDEQRIVTAGAIVAFLRSDSASDAARGAFVAAVGRLRDGDEAAFAPLADAVVAEQEALREFLGG
ncbi:MAG: hypothetical protein ACF8XB_05575 [Planctomycetota bacterium JB042]